MGVKDFSVKQGIVALLQGVRRAMSSEERREGTPRQVSADCAYDAEVTESRAWDM